MAWWRPPAVASAESVRGLAAILTLAAALRLPTLGSQSYWYDEAVTAMRVLRPGLGATLAAVYESESAPPLYYTIAWGWTRLAGTGAVGLRSLSALFGMLTVLACHAAASTLISRRAGLALAALAAVSPLLVWYSQEGRAYALAILLVAVSLWCLARAISSPSAPRVAAWCASAGLALCSHYFTVFPIAAEAVWLLCGTPRGARRGPVAAIAALGAIGAALIPLAVHQAASDHTGWIHRYALAVRLAGIPRMLLMGPSIAPYGTLTAILAVPVAVGLALLLTWDDARRRRLAVMALAAGSAAIVVPFVLAVAGIDYLAPHNTAVAWPAVMLAVAAGLAGRRGGIAGRLALGALVVASLAGTVAVAVTPRLQRPDWRGVASALGASSEGRLVLVPALGTVPLELYLHGRRLGPGPARVREVDVVSWERPRGAMRSPVGGLDAAGVTRLAQLTVTRFVGPRPVMVTAAQLARRTRAKALVTTAAPASGPPAPVG